MSSATRDVFLTYTCPVSRFTYAGHPRSGHLYEHTNDLRDAVERIKRIASSHGQPVSWVINDQEYLNREGLLPDLLRWKAEGDSLLVTMELTTSPPEVDKQDTEAVLRWIAARSADAGFTPDGLWSLKFYESDLQAILRLPKESFAWTRNLAGSCWHQKGIDESTWLGCPFNPYYPALWNVKAPARPDEPNEFLMLEWLTRDICACVAGGFPATFSLDPADANRRDAGGFDTEADALRYSEALIRETFAQSAFNRTVVIDINEEARHYQTEGHDKDFMLEGMFAEYAKLAASSDERVNVRQAGYREVWQHYRASHPHTPRGVFCCGDIDWRQGPVPGAGDEYNRRARGDAAVLFQSTDVQMAFLRSGGALPVEFFDYTARTPGGNANDPYPRTPAPRVQVRDVVFEESGADITVRAVLFCEEPAPLAGVMLWRDGLTGSERAAGASAGVLAAAPVSAGLCLLLQLPQGETAVEAKLTT